MSISVPPPSGDVERAVRAGDLKGYGKYRDANLKFVQKVPMSWGLRRLKTLAYVGYGLGQSPADDPEGLPFLRAGNVDHGRIVPDGMVFVSASDVPESRDAILDAGDIIVVRSGAYAGDSAIVPMEYKGAVAGYDMVVRVKDGWSPFVGWVLLSSYVRWGQVEPLRLRAAQPHLNAEELGGLIIAVPPVEEQRAIASFLDRETTKIDALIAKKEQLIALLEEKRAALISHVVTKGLEEGVEMKDSGVKWLGRMPKHWSVVPLKHTTYLDNSGVWGVEPENCADPMPVVRTADISPLGLIDVAGAPLRCLTLSERIHYACLVDDILVVKSSGSATSVISGKCGIVQQHHGELAFSNFLLRLRPRKDVVHASFLFRFLSSGIVKERIRLMVSTTTYPNLRVPEYMRFEIPVPPFQEQRKIAAALTELLRELDDLVDKIKLGLENLREFRTSLISAAVTGMIDVREVGTP